MRDNKYLTIILDRCYAIVDYSKGFNNLHDFENNKMAVEAIIFNLLQIGEIAKQKISSEELLEYSNVEWKQIFGLRNRIVHNYDSISLEDIYIIVKEDIPLLIEKLIKGKLLV